jgi:putative ABC transport system permease protein
MSTGARPPRSARALIERALPAELRDTVCADLDEMFQRRAARDGLGRARIWYTKQALAFAARFAWERVRGRERRRDSERAFQSNDSRIRVSLLDWKLGFRMLVKYPGLSLIAGLALATGIALGTGWFHFTMMELRPNLGLDEGDRIVRIDNWDRDAQNVESRSLHDFLAWRNQLTSIRELGASRGVLRNIVGTDGRAVPELISEISASAFPLTRVPPLLGRYLTEADEQPGGPDVVVLSHGVWQNRFAGDPGILGRVVQIGRTPATVVGVMPEGFGFPRIHRAWVPLRIAAAPEPRKGPPVLVFGRLADGLSMKTAQAELRTIGERMATTNPSTHALLQPQLYKFAAPRQESASGLVSLLIVNLIGVLILTALCANVTSLMLARTAMRESEVVVRTALGASRGRIIGQMMVEALVLALFSAVLGLTALSWMMDYGFSVSDRPAFWRQNYDLKPTTVAYAVGLAVLGAALVSILPALKATGSRVQDGLRNASAGNTSMRFGALWSGIIIFQVAVTVIALPVGVNFTIDAIREYGARSAFPTEEYLTFEAGFDADVLGEQATEDEVRGRAAAVFDQLEARLESEPGVLGVTYADGLPGMYHPPTMMEVQRGSEAPWSIAGIGGSSTGAGGPAPDGSVLTAYVDVEYFDALQVPVIAGRGFHNGDVGGENPPVIVNEALAEKLGGSPLGVRVRVPAIENEPAGPWHEIIGVVRNIGMDPTDEGEADFVFEPVGFEELMEPVVAVHVSGEPAALAAKVESIVAEIDPAFRVHEITMLDELLRKQDAGDVLAMLTATGANVLCILLSAASLFAVMAVGVARRGREIGIRLALGASKQGVLSALFGRAAKQLAAGVILGNVVFAALLVYYDSVNAQNLISLVGVSVLMGLVGLLACAVPARRALRIHPTQALRQ